MADDNGNGMLAPRVSPTVSKDKWTQIALRKLSKGWVVIIGEAKRSSNFFKPGSGFDPIPYSVATKMIETGLLKEEGTHRLGKRYVLSDGIDPVVAVPPAPAKVIDDDDDEENGDDYKELDDLTEIEGSYEEGEDDEESEVDES